MKYIITHQQEVIIFPDHLNHMAVSSLLRIGAPRSAGFVEIDRGVTRCYGESVSLRRAAAVGDDKIIDNQLRKKTIF